MTKLKQPPINIIHILFKNIFVLVLFMIPIFVDMARGASFGGAVAKMSKFSLVIAGIFLLVSIYEIVIYLCTFYYEENDSLVMETKFFGKNRKVLPYAKINTINIKQDLISKILGIKQVMLDSGSTISSAMNEFSIFATNSFSGKLVAYLNERVKCAKEQRPCTMQFPDKLSQVDDTSSIVINYDYKLSNKELVKASLMQLKNMLASFFTLFSTLGVVLGIYLDTLLGELAGGGAIAITVVTVGVILLSIIMGMLSTITKYYGFTLHSDEYYIYIRCGLFTVKEYKIPRGRINGVQIKQNLLQRWSGYYALQLLVVGFGGSEEEKWKTAYI